MYTYSLPDWIISNLAGDDVVDCRTQSLEDQVVGLLGGVDRVPEDVLGGIGAHGRLRVAEEPGLEEAGAATSMAHLFKSCTQFTPSRLASLVLNQQEQQEDNPNVQ